MPLPQTGWTLEMVQALPHDGNRYEILDGELLVSPSPTWRHQFVLQRLFLLLHPYVTALGGYVTMIAPADVAFTPVRVFEPDLFVVPRLADGRMPGAFADVQRLLLAVEVTSPSTSRNDRYRKRQVYQEQGVPEYWMVDPDARLIERWRPGDAVPEVRLDVMDWQPVATQPALAIDVIALFHAD